MISYIALFIALIGSLWTIAVISQLLIRKKNKPGQNRIKSIINHLTPFTAKAYSKDSLEFLFVQALSMLKYFIPSKNYKYYLPWYAAIGCEGAGKTTFFKSLQLENSIDSQSFCSDLSPCYWHFFNSGIFLDIKGELVLKNEVMPSSDEEEYAHLLGLIQKVRPNKGLDGLMIFISLKDLIGPAAKDSSQLVQHAEYLYGKLWQMQKVLGLKLPVYVVFTHLDYINGFDQFIKALPGYMKQDVFGWSVPYSLDSTFNPGWIDEMFATMSHRIQYLQSEIFVKCSEDINCNVLEFFSNFYKTIKPIKLVMERLFQTNAYAHSYYLRGAYFVGAEFNSQESSNWPQLPEKEGGQAKKTITISYLSHFFATKLVSQKVFLERNLGKFINKASASYLMQVKLMQLVIGAFILSSSLYLANSYTKLENSMYILNPKLSKVLQIIKEHKSEESAIDDAKLIQNSNTLMNSIINIFELKFKFIFIPSTWFSNLPYKISNMLEKANELVIFKAITKNIENKYKALAQMNIKDNHISNEAGNLSNPLEHPSYTKLCEFIEKMIELDQIEQKLNSAIENGNINSFAWLVNKLIGIDIPKNLSDSSNMFASALKNNSISISNLASYKKQIQANAKILFEQFINQAFELNNFMEKFNELSHALYLIEKKEKSFTFANLRSLQAQLGNIITFTNSHKFAWVHFTSFQLKHFIALIEHVNKSPLLGHMFAKEMERKTILKFMELKKNFQSIKMPLVGGVFYLDANETIKLSSSIIELQGVLNYLFNEVFMQEVDILEIKDIQYGKTVLWDVNILSYISDIFAQYDEFIAKKIKLYPSHITDTIKLVVKENLTNLIKTQIALAQNIVPVDFTNASMVAVANNVKISYGYVSSVLDRLKNINLDIYNKLLNIEKIRSLEVIKQAEEMLNAENLYSIPEGKIVMNHLVNGKLYFAMDVADYLATQRNRITYFAKEIVEPVIKTLVFIDNLDNFTLNPIIQKWTALIKDIDLYNQGPASNLFNLEDFLKRSEVLKIDDLANLVDYKEKLYIQTNNYFERKLIEIKRSLYNSLNVFTSEVINNNYLSLVNFYNRYSKFFPFNLDGELLPLDGVELFDQLLNKQEGELKIIKRINSKIKDPNMRFIETLEKMNKFVRFLTKPGITMKMEIKSASAFSELYEKNLQYLVSGHVRSGNNIIYFPDVGTLKIGDKVIFTLKLAKESGMSFGQMKDKTFAITSNQAIITLNKENFVRALFKYSITKDGQTVIVFELPIVDNDGKKSILAFPIPIEITQEGGVVYDFPEISINQLAQSAR